MHSIPSVRVSDKRELARGFGLPWAELKLPLAAEVVGMLYHQFGFPDDN